jgi:hypothetical protein
MSHDLQRLLLTSIERAPTFAFKVIILQPSQTQAQAGQKETQLRDSDFDITLVALPAAFRKREQVKYFGIKLIKVDIKFAKFSLLSNSES